MIRLLVNIRNEILRAESHHYDSKNTEMTTIKKRIHDYTEALGKKATPT